MVLFQRVPFPTQEDNAVFVKARSLVLGPEVFSQDPAHLLKPWVWPCLPRAGLGHVTTRGSGGPEEHQCPLT